MHEQEPQLNIFYEKLERLLEFSDPSSSSERFLRVLRTELTDKERELLDSNGYTIIEVKTMDELLSDKIRNLISNSQAIQVGTGQQTRPDLPSKLALVIPPDLIKQAKSQADQSFLTSWIMNAQYVTTIDETDL